MVGTPDAMRDQTDLERHVDHLHVNPAKHG